MSEQTNAVGELRINTIQREGTSVVELVGDLDVATSPGLRELLVALINDGATEIVLELSGLEFLDSTGLGVLVGAVRRLDQVGGTLVVRSPQHGPRQVFQMTGLDRVLTIEE